MNLHDANQAAHAVADLVAAYARLGENDSLREPLAKAIEALVRPIHVHPPA